ncbi:unnamed protein product [Lactuca saligna]|uniref:Uncharacterized protein n=1 Tax=Lactuca saligna TaxID=75948 RepID=A0AA35VKA7_LACSI|nr:unnamed protein product [Lactuca saligna]
MEAYNEIKGGGDGLLVTKWRPEVVAIGGYCCNRRLTGVVVLILLPPFFLISVGFRCRGMEKLPGIEGNNKLSLGMKLLGGGSGCLRVAGDVLPAFMEEESDREKREEVDDLCRMKALMHSFYNAPFISLTIYPDILPQNPTFHLSFPFLLLHLLATSLHRRPSSLPPLSPPFVFAAAAPTQVLLWNSFYHRPSSSTDSTIYIASLFRAF